MDEPRRRRAQVARETAAHIVDLMRWDREEQRAEAFAEILVAVEAGFERLAEVTQQVLGRAAGEPGRN